MEMQPFQLSKSNLTVPTASESTNSATALYLNLKSAPEKNQLQMIQELISTGDAGLTVLMEFLLDRRSTIFNATESATDSPQRTAGDKADIVAGKAYQALFNADSVQTNEFLQTHFPDGVTPLNSEVGIDYAPLQQLLAKREFQTADQVTLQKLCELAGSTAVQRKWLYFTEVQSLPTVDLQTINALWLTYSEGKFGFSVQRDIWLSVGKNWEKVWPKIGWKTGNNWTRYPQEFTWDLTAPRGHLPLSNQLRGVRAMASLLTHPAWLQSV